MRLYVLSCCILSLQLTCASDQPVVGNTARKQRPSWQARLSTYSIASVARRSKRTGWNEITQGNKIVLPPSVLEVLMSRNVPYTQFQIVNPDKSKKTIRLFTGPLEFSAAEGECYLPSWIMSQLKLKEGDQCAVATSCFPTAVHAKFQPHSSDFLDVSDHYMLLMRTLENFAALTAGSTVRVTDGKRVYSLDVIEVKGKEGARDDSNGRAVDLGLCELAFELMPPKDVVKAAPQSTKKTEVDEATLNSTDVTDVDASEKPPAKPPTKVSASEPANAAPVPKFKRKKQPEQVESIGPRPRRAEREAASTSLPRFAGKARSLDAEDDGKSDPASSKPKSALAQAREAIKLKEEQEAAAAAAAEEAAIPPLVTLNTDASVAYKSSFEPRHRWQVKVTRRVLELFQLILRVLTSVFQKLLDVLFTPNQVRFD